MAFNTSCFCCSVANSCPILYKSMNCQAPLSSTITQGLLQLMSVESAMPSNHLILMRWFCLLLLPSIFPSCRVFSKESALCIKWPSFGASVSASALPMNIRGWFPLGLTKFALLAVRRTLKSLLQYHNSKASALLGSTFFMIQLSPVVMYRCENFDYTDLGQENDVSAFEYTV